MVLQMFVCSCFKKQNHFLGITQTFSFTDFLFRLWTICHCSLLAKTQISCIKGRSLCKSVDFCAESNQNPPNKTTKLALMGQPRKTGNGSFYWGCVGSQLGHMQVKKKKNVINSWKRPIKTPRRAYRKCWTLNWWLSRLNISRLSVWLSKDRLYLQRKQREKLCWWKHLPTVSQRLQFFHHMSENYKHHRPISRFIREPQC